MTEQHISTPNTPFAIRAAKFAIGQVVKHRAYPFRGVIFDVDPIFDNTEEWYEAIPADIRPEKDQPYYHLFAENDEGEYVAYVSEQNLVPDLSPEPVRHPQVAEFLRLKMAVDIARLKWISIKLTPSFNVKNLA